MHKRLEIRDAIKQVLLSSTSAGDLVYTSRNDKMWEAGFPCIVIYDNQESRALLSNQGGDLRTLSVIVEGRVTAESDVDDALDNLANEIESAMFDGVNTILALVERISQSNTEKSVNNDSEVSAGAVRITYDVTYLVE